MRPSADFGNWRNTRCCSGCSGNGRRGVSAGCQPALAQLAAGMASSTARRMRRPGVPISATYTELNRTPETLFDSVSYMNEVLSGERRSLLDLPKTGEGKKRFLGAGRRPQGRPFCPRRGQACSCACRLGRTRLLGQSSARLGQNSAVDHACPHEDAWPLGTPLLPFCPRRGQASPGASVLPKTRS